MVDSRFALLVSSALALVVAVGVPACSNDDSAGDAAAGGEGGHGAAAGTSSLASGAGQTGVLPRVGDGTPDAGASAGGAGCEIDLAEFVNNGYRTCPPNDSAAVAGECWPDAQREFGSRGVCNNYRLWAFGHDGRIGCAYDALSGDLVGGFLYGIPSSAPLSCFTAYAGPEALAHCPEPNTPWCPDPPEETGGLGGASGVGGEAGATSVQGGAGGAVAQGGAAGQP